MKPNNDIVQTALKYLERRSYSQHQLEVKLASAGFGAIEIAGVVERLLGWAYLNDYEFGLERIRLLIERCKSRAYVCEDLHACGMALKLIDELIAKEYPIALEAQVAAHFLAKRPSSWRNSPLWAVQALTRAGFSDETIRSCLGEPPPT